MQDFIDIHLNSTLFFSKHIVKSDYDICYSELIDDYYWNYAFLKNNKTDLNKTCLDIIKKMYDIKRSPTLYITSDILNYGLEKYLEDNKFKLLYTDSWLILDDIDKLLPYKSSLNFKTKQVDKSNINKFAKIVMTGFSGDNPDDPYNGLSDGYQKCIEKSVFETNDKYRTIHFVGQKDGEMISTASVVCKKNSAIFYNITTDKKYQKLGVCKQMMSDIINELKNLGINKFCIQTEANYYTEEIYQKFGFKKSIFGKAYKMEE